MKKLCSLIVASLIILTTLITCSEEEVISLVKQQVSMSDVYLTINLNNQTTSNQSPIIGQQQPVVNRCILEIYLGDILCNRLTCEIKAEQANFLLNIPSPREYNFVVWADYVEDSNSDGTIDEIELESDVYYYTQQGLKNINIDLDRFPYDGNNHYRDSFYGSSSTLITDHCDMIINLDRPFAQLNIISDLNIDSLDQYPSDIKVDFLTAIPTRLNAMTGEVSQEQHIQWNDKKPIIDIEHTLDNTSGILLTSDYLFCPSSTGKDIDLSISLFYQNGTIIKNDTINSIVNIPLKRNYFTNINFQQLNILSDYTVDILPIYDINTPTGIEYFTFDDFPSDFSSIKSGTWVISGSPRSDEDFIKIRKALESRSGSSTIRLQFPDVEIMPEYIFADIDNLESVVATNLHTVGHSAFSNCSKLKHIHMPKAKIIKTLAFKNCNSLKTVELHNVTRIESYAFKSIAIESLYLPKVIFIGANAFENCQELRHIELPLLRHIEKNSFKDCNKLAVAIISTQSENVSYISPLIFGGTCRTQKIHLTTSRYNSTSIIDEINWVVPENATKNKIGPFQFITTVS